MKIIELATLAKQRNLIGKHVDIGRQVLRDGGKMWIFTSMAELDICQDLGRDEISQCRRKFVCGEPFVIVYRWENIIAQSDDTQLNRPQKGDSHGQQKMERRADPVLH
ncbi:hypothetical protein KKC88_03520 [Patescibacteria group bacterium]|nr:hypothetical protein [Patescibacteria group bacterium]MBU1673558.1 hypothetical protein [Patescibacteria group bacterium]MBU1963636.1 hypothetical protein [Patescibacteria group bacterium]